MQTIQTKEIDGYRVILKINSALGMEDPVATQKVVAGKIQDEAVYKKIDAIKSQMGVYIQQAVMAGRNAKSAKISGQPWQAFWDEHLTRTAQAKACEEELKPLAVEIKKKYGELMMKHAVYFNLSNGEELIEDAEADEIESLMNAAYTEGKVLCRDKSTVINNVGRVYWKKTDKWAKTEIKKLGEVAPIGGIEMQNFNDVQKAEIVAQIEAERIAGLTPQVKTDEKNQVLAAINVKAGAMHSELLVQGDAAALTKAKAWQTAEIQKVEAKYT